MAGSHSGFGVAVACALALGACTEPAAPAPLARPLIGGQVEQGFPGVVALSRSRKPFCSGTLVSPRVVLTAGHCVDTFAGDPSVTIYFGTDVAGAGTRLGVVKAEAHPEWTGELVDNHDVGLLLLDFAADPEHAMPLHDGPPTVGTEIVRVGFGVHDGETDEPDGKKRSGTTSINYVSRSQDWFIAGHEDLRACRGDSGGPALVEEDGRLEILGVHSFGFGCESPDGGDTRVDFYADEFIRPWIEANDPTCGADGLCARVGCAADPDCEPCGADGTCAEGCALPDVDCPTQGVGEICRADTQCETGLCVFWQPEPGTRFCSRPCEPGAGGCPEGMSCQSIQPFGSICYHDGEPPGTLRSRCEEHTDCASYLCRDGFCTIECDLTAGRRCPGNLECVRGAADDDSIYYCEAPPVDGSCSAGQGGGRSSLTAAALLLAALFCGAFRRRGRSHLRH